MDISNYLASAVFNGVLRNTQYTVPTTVYVALFSVAPTAAWGGTEITGNGYARQAITFAAPTNGVGSNSAQVLFPNATPLAYDPIVAVALFDNVSGGNQLFQKTLGSPVTVNAGDQAKFDAGAFTVTIG